MIKPQTQHNRLTNTASWSMQFSNHHLDSIKVVAS